MKKLPAFLAALMMATLCLLSAAAQTIPADPVKPSVSAVRAALDDMAGKNGLRNFWITQSAGDGLTAHINLTSDIRPNLLASGDTLVMLTIGVNFDPGSDFPYAAFIDSTLLMTVSVLVATGVPEAEAYQAMLPMVNDEGFLRGLDAAAAGEVFWFLCDGYEAIIARNDVGSQPRLCLYLYTAPELIP